MARSVRRVRRSGHVPRSRRGAAARRSRSLGSPDPRIQRRVHRSVSSAVTTLRRGVRDRGPVLWRHGRLLDTRRLIAEQRFGSLHARRAAGDLRQNAGGDLVCLGGQRGQAADALGVGPTIDSCCWGRRALSGLAKQLPTPQECRACRTPGPSPDLPRVTAGIELSQPWCDNVTDVAAGTDDPDRAPTSGTCHARAARRPGHVPLH